MVFLGTRYSYQRLKDLSETFASALLHLGVKQGDKVILYVPNSIQWVIVWLGIQRIGGVCVPITPIYTPYDIEYIANDSGAVAIVCADINFGYVTRVLPKTNIKLVVISRMADLLPWWKRLFGFLFDRTPKGRIGLVENTYLLRKLLSKYHGQTDQLPEVEQAAEDLVEIMYTGGTTMRPKGVPVTSNSFLQSCHISVGGFAALIPPETNIIASNAPLFHILGQTAGMSTIIVGGGTLLIYPRVNLDAFLEAIQRFRVKTMLGVPLLYRMILEHSRLDQYDLSSVEIWFAGGDVLPVEVGNRWRDKFGKFICQAYGTTETCGGISMCPLDKDSPPKSAGRLYPGVKIQIVDPATLKPVKPGEPGELLVTLDSMVRSYWNNPEETKKSFVKLDGVVWYRTSDIMSMDEEGNLYFLDRTVDTIKHKGYRVSSSEIESLLKEHPAIMDSCVVGVPDSRVGERIKAFVVLKEDIKGITGYDLIRWCRERLPSYKVPQYIEFRDMLPKSKVGKLLRREMRSEEMRRQEK